LEPKRLRVQEGKDQVFFLLDAQQRYATAESGFYRAIVDYNQALLNLSWTSGQLLNRYNVHVEEGDWEEGLIGVAQDKADRFIPGDTLSTAIDPVSAGEFNQDGAGTIIQ
jgi:hypothetical protein